MITAETVVSKLAAYLRREMPLEALVDWAESAMMDGEFDEQQIDKVRDVVARLGLADVRAFGLTWEDCEQFLKTLGYSAHVEIVAR